MAKAQQVGDRKECWPSTTALCQDGSPHVESSSPSKTAGRYSLSDGSFPRLRSTSGRSLCESTRLEDVLPATWRRCCSMHIHLMTMAGFPASRSYLACASKRYCSTFASSHIRRGGVHVCRWRRRSQSPIELWMSVSVDVEAEKDDYLRMRGAKFRCCPLIGVKLQG